MVLGDGMADWLAYGLEEANAEKPAMGVIRKNKAGSGLLRYEPKGGPADWPAAAKGILAREKPDAIVVMFGLNDRVQIREPAVDNSADKTGDKKGARSKTGDAKTATTPADTAPELNNTPVDTELSPDDATDNETPQVITPAKSGRSPSGGYEFRDERWVELYTKKIEEMIAVLKSKGAPVLWVGLPAVRGVKGTADML